MRERSGPEKARMWLMYSNWWIVCLALSLSPTALALPVSISSLGVPYTQDFNSLASRGSDNTILPSGWAIHETGTNADGKYGAGTGSSHTGDIYSFGAASSNERALGGLRSGSLIPLFGVEFRNDTGEVISSLEIEFWGEQWRLGTSSRADQLDFQFSTDATGLNNGTWVEVDELDFVSPVTGENVSGKDGNSGSYRTLRSGLISGLGILPGDTLWLRWKDFDASGADDGLAVDDFKLTARGAAVSHTVPDTGKTLPLGLTGLCGVGIWARRRRLTGK